MAPAPLSLVCFRLNDGGSEAALDEKNRQLLDLVNATGKLFMTHTSLRGRFTLRMAIGQRTTTEDHVRRAWSIIQEKASTL